MRPSKLLHAIGVPGLNVRTKLFVTEMAGSEPFNGWLEDQDGNVVGRLNNFRFEFVGFSPVTQEERARQSEGESAVKKIPATFIHPFSDRILWMGDAVTLGDYIKGFLGHHQSARFEFTTTAEIIDIDFHAHGWSGIAWVQINGEDYTEIDLFNKECAIRRPLRIENVERREITISAGPTGRANPEAQDQQLLIEGFSEYVGKPETPVYNKSIARNRGGEFHPRFFELLGKLAPDALVLDVGGGKRQLDDDRYINLEYTAHDEPDILGDGTCLPFLSDTFDLVYTAAVLEHVRDPLAMGREIYRVLKPGGMVLANSAFMQPIHSEGQHFFNLTPYGIELVFEQFEVQKSWADCSFAFTMEWFVDVLGVSSVISQEKIHQFISIAKEIDSNISHDRAKYVASGVWLEGKK